MTSILRRARARLLASLALLMILVGLGTAGIYRIALHKATAARAEELAGFYASRVAQLERDWEQQTRDFRVRLEITRLLERPVPAVTELQAFMTVQGSNRHFQHLQIEDRSGAKVFAYGRSLELLHIPTAPGETRGWYADPQSGDLYRVLVEPIWLGRAGIGRMAAFFPIDHATMGQLASPGIRLTAFHHQAPVASSLGQRGIDQAAAPIEGEARDIPWGNPQETATRLRIEAPPATLFSTTDLALSVGTIPLFDGLVLWFVLGTWMIRQARRVNSLGGAVAEFNREGRLTEGLAQRLDAAAGADEIGAVAHSLRDMAEQQVLDTDLRREGESWRRLWAMVFASSHEAVVITDRDCRILSINAAFTQLTGYAEAEVLGRNPRILASGCEGPEFYGAMWDSVVKADRWSGEILDRRKDGSTYPKWLEIVAVRDAQGSISHYVGTFSDITERKRAEERSTFLATHDHLTGLPNRSLLLDRLAAAIRLSDGGRRGIALLFMDLDNVNWVNDSLGHAAGDRLLVAVAERLRAAVRPLDTVARLGGDEFVVLMTGTEGLREIGIQAQKMIDTVAGPMDVDGIEVHIAASVGISLFPNDGDNPAALLRHAAAARHAAGDAGRNQCRFFDPSMNADARGRMELETELHQGIRRGEFELFYQPLLHARTGSLRGAEALIRWHRPQRGLTFPDSFIPLAEETGLVVPLGLWVIRSACEQLAAWERAGRPLCRIAINLSANQVESDAFVNSVRAILDETGIAPEWLEFELTESVVMRDPERSIATLQALRGLGLRLSLDDFGTGYSSLSHLKRLPIDAVKIDRSFVEGLPDDPDDARIVQMIVALAKACGLEVVAEGISTNHQRIFLEGLGCDYLQGYLIAQPLLAVDLAERLAHASIGPVGAAA